jgi:type I restriction enzyme S subunit
VREAKSRRVITDGDHQPPPKTNEGVAFLTIGNITTGRLDFSGCRWVPRAYFRSLAPYRTPAQGDILYTVVGATYGRPAIVDTDREFCVQRHIAILKPTPAMDLRFLVWMLASPLIYDQATSSTTGTAQPTIALRPLRNFIAPIPPLAEQRRIVARLDELMALCDRLESSLATADETRCRLLEALLAEALAPAEERELEAAE